MKNTRNTVITSALMLTLSFNLVSCTKEGSKSTQHNPTSTSYIPTKTAVLNDLKDFVLGKTGTATRDEAEKMLKFLAGDITIHNVATYPESVCGEIKSGWHLTIFPAGATYTASYGKDDGHEFIDSLPANKFTIDPKTNSSSGSGSGGNTGSGSSSNSCTSNPGFGNYTLDKKYTNTQCISYSTLSYGCSGIDVRLGYLSNNNYIKISNMPSGTGTFKINNFFTCGNCDLYVTDENSSGSVSGTLTKKTSTCFSFTCTIKDGAGLTSTISGDGNYK